MGLFGSLFTGVSALFAQSQNTAIISNNIANVGTTGFKRSEASFNSLVTTQSRLSTYSPGTVTATRLQKVNQQGSIQQTSSSTDAAISGNGFFPVKRSTQAGQEFLYTRAGTFSEDSQGLLRNASNFILYAWPIDSNGALPANQGDLTSLVPADVAFLGGLTRPTTNAEIAVNLDADQAPLNNDLFSTPSVLPIPETQPAHFSRGLTVFDALGSSQTLTFEYRKIVGPMANATTAQTNFDLTSSTVLVGDGGTPASIGALTDLAVGDAFSIEYNTTNAATGNGQTTSETFEFTDAIVAPVIAGSNEITDTQSLLDAINNFGGGGVLEARLDSSNRLKIVSVNPTATLKFANVTGTPVSDINGLNLIVDSQGLSEQSTAYFPLSTSLLTVATDLAAGGGETITVTVDGVAYTTAAFDPSTTTVAGYIALLDAALSPGLVQLNTVLASTYVNGRIRYEPLDINSTYSISSATTPGFTTGTDGLGFPGSGGGGYVYEPEAPIQPTAGTAYRSNDPYARQGDFPVFQETGAPNTQGWWELTIIHPDGTNVSQGLLNFNGDGTLNALADSDNEIDIELNNINWFNGADLQTIEVDISRFSQFAGNYDVIFSDQNGAELGLRTGVEITREGIIVARFSNGASADLYKMPLITFANPNGLNEVSGTAYSETEDSGEENLREAGAGGAGFVEPSTLEASNVDLADEFAKLIISQRAFGAATRTINTIDQMTQDLLSLRG